MTNQLVKVKRDVIAACMTCPLCHNLFRDATTISECLHTCEFLVNVTCLNFQLVSIFPIELFPVGFTIWVLLCLHYLSWRESFAHLGVSSLLIVTKL